MRYIPVLIGIMALLLSFPLAAAIGGDEGWIEVRSNVDGASVLFDGSFKGVIAGGSLTVPVYTTGAPYSQVVVEKSGYTSYSGPLTMPAAGQTTTVYATLNPLPVPPTPVQYGSIYVESQPSGAQIYFNGDYRGLAPLTIRDVWPGSYTIGAELNGYHKYSTPATVSSGQQTNIYCSLSPMESYGSLYVLSNPSGASIYLDSVYEGRTPMTISHVSAGTHTLEVDKAGYYDWRSTVSVPSGGTNTVSATLNPMPSSTVGWVYVASSPGGAAVTLDGRPVGQTPYSGSLKIDNVAAGSHTVALSLAGYAPYSAPVTVSPNTVTEVSALLQPSAPVTTTGAVSVSSEPAGAQVFLDNAFVGITPLTLNSVTTGSHSITIRMTGYNEYTVTTPVNAGATSTVSAALQHATEPTPKSPVSPAIVIAAFGIIGFVAARRIR